MQAGCSHLHEMFYQQYVVEKEYVRGPEVINDVMFDAVVLFNKDKHQVQIKSSDWFTESSGTRFTTSRGRHSAKSSFGISKVFVAAYTGRLGRDE